MKYKKKAHQEKERKKLSKKKPCTGANRPNPQKRRRTDVELLSIAGGSGGRANAAAAASAPAVPGPRTNVPVVCSYAEGQYNHDHFNKYLCFVNECESAAQKSNAEAIQAEAADIVRKLRGLLDPSIRSEVDYEEACEDFSPILVSWKADNPIGRRAFIPTEQDKCMAVNALRIINCAAEERIQILQECIDKFGDEGVDIFNELLSNISDGIKIRCPLSTCVSGHGLRSLKMTSLVIFGQTCLL